MKQTTTIGAMGAAWVLASAAQAATISWSIFDNINVTAFPASVDPSNTAGFVPVNVDNWNQSISDTSGLLEDLVDDSGSPTTVDISWNAAPNTNQAGDATQDADGSYNKLMFNSYLNATDGSIITVAEIPYAQYDIYVYFNTDTVSRIYDVSDGVTTYYQGFLDDANTGADANFVLGTATSDPGVDSRVDASYVVFSGLSGTSQTITKNGEFGGMSAIQIVEVPEPSVALLGGFGLLGLLRRRRA